MLERKGEPGWKDGMEDLLQRTRRVVRGLIAEHGGLVEVFCRTGPPQDCRADLIFADGYEIAVTAQENALGLSVTFGYWGAGPRLFHGLLLEAGFGLSEEDVAAIKAPCVLRQGSPQDFTSGRTSRDELAAEGFQACELTRYAKARACYTQATELYPGDGVSWYNLGVVESRQENWQAAMQAFDRVLALGQHTALAAYVKALCSRKLDLPVELPPDFAGKAERLGTEATARNLAAELENRGYAPCLEPKENACSVVLPVEEGKYTILFCDYGIGTIHVDAYKEDSSGNSHRIADRHAYPNRTEKDKEILSLTRSALPFQPVQLPVVLADGSRAMDVASYVKATQLARERSEIRMFGPHGWVRRGETFEEEDRKRYAGAPRTIVHVERFIGDETFARWAGEPGQGAFNCVFDGEPHTAVAFDVDREMAKKLKHSLHQGAVRFHVSVHRCPTYPVLYQIMAVRMGGTDEKWTALVNEAVGDFTDANLQEWVVRARETRKTQLHAFGPRGWALGTYEVPLTDDYLQALAAAMDEADRALRAIPRAKWDFVAAARQFWRDHPEPLVPSDGG